MDQAVFSLREIIIIAVCVLSVWILAILLKIFFHKSRPSTKNLHTFFTPELKFSFPSEHSAVAASLAMMGYQLNLWLGLILAAIAIGVGISRITLGVHYPRDVIFGWFLGLMVGLLFAQII